MSIGPERQLKPRNSLLFFGGCLLGGAVWAYAFKGLTALCLMVQAWL